MIQIDEVIRQLKRRSELSMQQAKEAWSDDDKNQSAYSRGRSDAFKDAYQLVQRAIPPIDVVAAVRLDEQGRVWVCRRGSDGEHAGLQGMWEYPGGKVEPDEQLREALIREIQEEFGVTPWVGEVLDLITTAYKGRMFRVTFFEIRIDEEVELRVHTEARWMTLSEVLSVEHLPSGTIFNASTLQSILRPVDYGPLDFEFMCGCRMVDGHWVKECERDREDGS